MCTMQQSQKLSLWPLTFQEEEEKNWNLRLDVYKNIYARLPLAAVSKKKRPPTEEEKIKRPATECTIYTIYLYSPFYPCGSSHIT